MKLTRSLTFQLGSLIIGILVVMLAITSVATYKTAYDKLFDAAGIEAYGCANITTGLILPDDMEKALGGDSDVQDEIGKQLNWTIEHKSIFETQYILTLDGTIVALDDNLKAKGFAPGDDFHIDREAIEMLKEMKHPTYSKAYNYADMKRLSGYAPIFKDHDPSKEVIAVSVIDFDASIVSSRTWDVVRNGILISIVPLLLAALLTLFLLRKKTKPISSLIEHSRQIADGNLSLSDVPVESQDEVGDLAKTLNTLSANLRTMIGTVGSTASKLTMSTSRTSDSLKEMEGAAHMVSENINEAASSTADGGASAEQAAQLMKDLAEGLRQADRRAGNAAAISNNTKLLSEEGRQRAVLLNDDMQKIRQSALSSQTAIEGLIGSAKKIQLITESISDIAAQTNLLALNASIEAARAGEHGKGFAVVAEEVRLLAEQSNEDVQQVGALIQGISSSISKVVRSSEESGELIESGSDTVRKTADTLGGISAAVEETVKEVEAISENLIKESRLSEEAEQHIRQLADAIHSIEEMTANISASGEETSATITEVAGQSDDMKRLAEELEASIRKFRLAEDGDSGTVS
ncbi:MULTISPECIES: methyl-accepting chemotaxis protein [Sporosarcina]|uniref:methyl-accepting chemotaxis protein n=1 Tax=Sporosarcina TaxID=1569 RepID=UPI00058D652B|nr:MULTISPECIES: HAMP domain-containing methyl-accepting chemotaxis protein [Sporosarcina]WJY28219.1 HAMP domain-containing methyl-accepting chemotaxis protein [Sporosarcina sp. 0.2-SM1T-5]